MLTIVESRNARKAPNPATSRTDADEGRRRRVRLANPLPPCNEMCMRAGARGVPGSDFWELRNRYTHLQPTR
ncbi:Uncharacterised protein [Mycobacterium tuberculosis]|uniref:Uncharacterized protein n=1 Tax=Mycobacterium tuberculosis TaxID=1773 RepID=A0A0U0U618_MYCTX|nr:Uncharacterised protein [Mycobacterium tuberculosis]CNL26478.1 Uncharacterised protein [Mycobacterium tuberculosis]CNM15774.1 Uncharacterised protein [Mycobacterium tuberculosis]COV43191.1 Uncharacterised protein [Mycobacterium tuberculosis]COX83386.1 Uncharacterised protein [Mycobacterium tuberculosis]